MIPNEATVAMLASIENNVKTFNVLINESGIIIINVININILSDGASFQDEDTTYNIIFI